ncbi:hypothetical protein F1B92_04530 [Campylobacter sp. FMV-PI01]|uniref:Phage head morphogenesis domain-containing protein n=1 Tax=Campylobacter portucalensis TaxID=2608384 RepID=A0A6L5WHR5_9BACT|nr:hypothetical protein [Campylobacter portucalensis]MSN96446.1 hypothetical protein [Campylobacter portucalensis]
MRFFKSFTRYSIIKNSDDIDVFLETYAKDKKENLEKILAEIVDVSSTKTDLKLLKKLLIQKIESLNLDVSPEYLEALYIALAKKATKKIALNSVKFTFDSVDKNAINAMRKGFYWMGREYNEKLQVRLKDRIEKVFTGEINEIPKALKDEFGAIINADESYFKGVADHIALQSSNVARVTQGAKYGVSHYKVLAVMDDRTSEICRSMHGRIIEAFHLENQVNSLLNAKSMADKKNAAIWQNKAYNGRSDKMASNFGLPPYHFRCRTEVVPVWVESEEIDGVMMQNTSPLRSDEVIKHIDKMGVERVLDKKAANGYHGLKDRLNSNKEFKKDLIKALNSITNTAPHKKKSNQLNAISSNGYFLTFDGNRIITAFKPKKGLKQYFKDSSVTLNQEIIKRWWV